MLQSASCIIARYGHVGQQRQYLQIDYGNCRIRLETPDYVSLLVRR